VRAAHGRTCASISTDLLYAAVEASANQAGMAKRSLRKRCWLEQGGFASRPAGRANQACISLERDQAPLFKPAGTPTFAYVTTAPRRSEVNRAKRGQATMMFMRTP
jgi:hypothetical protein